MAHYLTVRVYLGFHYVHCPLETRKNISPTAVSVLFTSDRKRSEVVPVPIENSQVSKSVQWCPAQQFLLTLFYMLFKTFLNYLFINLCPERALTRPLNPTFPRVNASSGTY